MHKIILGIILISISNMAVAQELTERKPRDAEEIRRGLKSTKSETYEIYKSYLSGNPEFSGEINFQFQVMANGTVGNYKILNSSIDNEHFHNEISKIILNMKFESLDVEATTVSYNFIFKP